MSCTGIGEEITQQAVAAKIVTRVEDGMSLNGAVSKTMMESDYFNYSFGLISLDANGQIEVGKTTELSEVYFAYHNGEGIETFYN